jgi:hypothetical protein
MLFNSYAPSVSEEDGTIVAPLGWPPGGSVRENSAVTAKADLEHVL